MTDEYKEKIKDQPTTPDFFFPIDAGSAWSDKKTEEADYKQGELWRQGKAQPSNLGIYYWIVEGPEDIDMLFGKIQDARVLAYRTIGEIDEI